VRFPVSLFDEQETYTPRALVIAEEASIVLEAFFRKHKAESIRELSHILMTAVADVETRLVVSNLLAQNAEESTMREHTL
jgi:hypothetical protein